MARTWRWEYGRRDKGGGGREVTESYAGRNGPQYAGTETGDAGVGELSFVDTRQSARDIGKGHEWVGPLGRHRVAGGKGRIGFKKNSYIKSATHPSYGDVPVRGWNITTS